MRRKLHELAAEVRSHAGTVHEASQQIAGSVLLTRQGNGHVSYDKSRCAQQAEDNYLISLTLPADGTVCTDSQ